MNKILKEILRLKTRRAVFVIEKSLIVVIFLYSTSFTLIAVQYSFADPIHLTLFGSQVGGGGVLVNTNLSSALVQISCINNSAACPNSINQSDLNVTSTSRAQIVGNPITAAAGIAWTLIQLIFGAYIFNILILFGVPPLFVFGLSLVYFFLVIRSVVGYIRGI